EYKDNDRSGGNESDTKPSFLDISMAKEQASKASSKAKVQACGSKTFGVKIPPTMTCAEEKKGKRLAVINNNQAIIQAINQSNMVSQTISIHS
ncbi:hypothetical protein Tco_0229923, partial [Tanacetum coccineum]